MPVIGGRRFPYTKEGIKKAIDTASSMHQTKKIREGMKKLMGGGMKGLSEKNMKTRKMTEIMKKYKIRPKGY